MLYPQFETILLAAGLSARMGTRNKLLIEIDKVPLIRRSAALYCGLGMTVTVVLGHEAGAIEKALFGLPLKTVLNTEYASGQKSSIRAGLAAASLQGDGVLIALGDQPLLESSDISGICEAFLNSERNKILVPWFKDQRGNPTLLPIGVARQLRVDSLLPRTFMEANPHMVERHKAPNAHFTTDLDTPEDVQHVVEG